ncbi:hypothetical protein IAT38_000345 [Cryptococcus sp. DSM 104549]
MLSSLREVITGKPRPDTAEYQPVLNPYDNGAIPRTSSPSGSLGRDRDDVYGDDDVRAPSREEVKSSEGKVYFCFWALGAGVLLSWNALICTFPLLISYFPTDSTIRPILASCLSTVYCFGNLFFLGLAQRHVGRVSPFRRLRLSLHLLLFLSIILAFPLLPLLLPAFPPAVLLPSLILIALLLSLSTAYLQSSVFALASLWGSEQVLGVMSGQGGIAVMVSGVQCFLAASTALGKKVASDPDSGDGAEASRAAGVGLWTLGSAGTVGCLIALGYLVRHPAYQGIVAPKVAAGAGVVGTGEQGTGAEGAGTKSVTRKVLGKNWELEIAVAFVFVVTLSVFPPVTTTILSTHQPTPRLLQPDVFIPLHFLLFNIGDYVGRTYLPAIPSLLFTSPKRILTLSISRALFIPLFFACNVTPRAVGNLPLINSDVLYFIVMLLFGTTNGYIGSLCMIVASSPALNPRIKEDERDVAATLASFCLVAGLAGGSLASFAVTWGISKGL